MVKTALQRRRAKALMKLLNLYAWSVLYAQIRPMQTASLTLKALRKLLKLGHTITMDCSEAVYLILRLAGFNVRKAGYIAGTGYTGTLLAFLRHFTDWNQVHVGTIIVIGYGTGDHAVMVYKPNGDNPLVYTHGSHARSAIWSFQEEMTYHPGQPYTLLAVDNL
jgi:hypothetical protein